MVGSRTFTLVDSRVAESPLLNSEISCAPVCIAVCLCSASLITFIQWTSRNSNCLAVSTTQISFDSCVGLVALYPDTEPFGQLGVSLPANPRESPVMIVSELCANGDLFDYVRNVPPPSLYKVVRPLCF